VVSGQRSEVRSPISDLRSPPSGPYFLASARFVEKKNLPRLIQAYARYRQLVENEENRKQKAENQDQFQLSEFQLSAFSPWPLVLVGDGPLRSDLCHLLSGLRLKSSILLPGFKQYPELPAFYASAGAFIHASTTEQWGLVVNEAMASGLPVLVSNRCGCATDLVQAGVNGFTFDPCDVEQLAQLMLKISAFKAFSSPPRPGRGTQGEVSNSDSNPPSALSRQSSILHPPSSTLAEMGAASREIIADWGPERFAAGLKAAAECALKVGPVKPSLLQRVLLTALLRR